MSNTNLVPFSGVTSDRIVVATSSVGSLGSQKRYLGHGTNEKRQKSRILGILRKAAETAPGSVTVERAPSGHLILSTNLRGTRYTVVVQAHDAVGTYSDGLQDGSTPGARALNQADRQYFSADYCRGYDLARSWESGVAG